MAAWLSYFRMTAFSALLAFGVTACNDDDPAFVGGGTGAGEEQGIPGLPEDVLGLFAYNGSTEVETNIWSENASLGLFMTKDSINNPYENDRNTYSNIKCLYTKMGWLTDPRQIKLSDRPAVIYAYSPYRKNVDPLFIPVECVSGEFYMYGTHLEPQTSVRKGDNVAKLHMKHVLALVDFRIRKRDWDGELVLEKVVLRRKAAALPDSTSVDTRSADSLAVVPDSVRFLPVEGVFDIRDGKLTHTAYGQYVTDNLNAVVTDNFTTSARVIQTVIPRSVGKDDVELVFTLNGFERSVTLREGKDWSAGARSIINLTFTGEGFEIEEDIKPWQDVEQDIMIGI